MENSGILATHKTRPWLKLTVLKILIWIGILAACGIYGLEGPGRSAAQSSGGHFDSEVALSVMMYFLSLGAGIATSVVVGISAIVNVQKNGLKRRTAVAVAFLAILFAPMVTMLILTTLTVINKNFSHEEEAELTRIGVAWWAFEAASAWFAICVAIIVSVKRRPFVA